MKKFFLLIFLSILTFASNIWHKDNIYDETTMSYTIPVELWFELPSNEKNKSILEGPFNWYHPYLKKQLKVYKKTLNNQIELFTFYPKGVAKVFDKRGDVYLNNGLVFPAGLEWKIDKMYNFSEELWIKDKHIIRNVGIRIVKINFKNEILDFIEYQYYLDYRLIDTYNYEIPQGLNK